MGDLSWIESQYGSVAEYNRCMDERDHGSQEDYAEENWRTVERYIAMDMQGELEEKLSLPVSDSAKAAASDDLTFRKETSDVAAQYGVSFHERRPAPESNKFSVSYEYVKDGMYHHMHSDNVDTDTFMKVYNDMHHLNPHGVSYNYYDENNIAHGSTGVSLSYVRSSDFPRLDIDDPEGRSIIHDVKSKYREIRDEKKAAFDREEAERAKNRQDYVCDDMSYYEGCDY